MVPIKSNKNVYVHLVVVEICYVAESMRTLAAKKVSKLNGI